MESYGVEVGFDGKWFHNDNLFVERLWRIVGYEESLLKAYQGEEDAIAGIGELRFDNEERRHQTLGYPLIPFNDFASAFYRAVPDMKPVYSVGGFEMVNERMSSVSPPISNHGSINWKLRTSSFPTI